MKISCIIKNTKILSQLEDLVSRIADNLVLKDVLPTPSNIYNEVRNLGVEIDLSTIGAIYAKNLSGTDSSYKSVKEVETEIGADFNNVVKKIIQLDKGTKELGKQSPAEAVAKAISNIFIDRNAAPQTKTLMRQMQDIMLRGLKRHLPKDSPLKNSVSPFDVARQALDSMNRLGVTDLSGQLNNLEDLFVDVKAELNKYLNELRTNASVPHATVAKYEDMIENVKNSTYQLLLSRSEAKDVVTEAVKKYQNGKYTKTDKNGKVTLDYDALSGHIKSEQELRENVEQALEADGFLTNEIDIITNSLASEFKDAYANILQKAINKLNQKANAKDREVISKSDAERLANLHALGAFGSAHEKMIYELLGLSENSGIDLSRVEKIADELNRMKDAGFTEGNEKERALNSEIDQIISQARYRDAPFIYKAAKAMSDLFSMANLSTLNNIKNRVENFSSGGMENVNQYVARGAKRLPSEISKLAAATKRDIVVNGGNSFGEMDMFFKGDSSVTERIGAKLSGWISGGKEGQERIANWWYNQIMGVAALNGMDSYNKIKQTWSRFIGQMENLLIEKGTAKTRKEAQEILHKQLFGKAWEQAEVKAKQLTDVIENGGSVLKKTTPEMIKRLAADIAKAELVNNNVITQKELEDAWNASYKAAGRALGHVSNNWFSTALQGLNNKSREQIEKRVAKGDYKFAAMLTFADLFVNKIILKFAGGGTNWVVLNVEKTGLGLLLGGAKKLAIGKQKSISEMNPKEVEEELYRQQVQNDKIVRGAVGGAVNVGMFLLAYAAFGGSDDESKKRREKLLNWVDKNRWSNKYINVLPLYISGYLAVMKQKETNKGIAGTFDKYRYSPLKNFLDNFTNNRDTYSFDNQFGKAINGLMSGKEKSKEDGWKTIGTMMGNYFNVDPLPYRPIKDMVDVFDGIFGNDTKADRDQKSKANRQNDGSVNWLKEMISGYRKYGITDW